MGDPDETPTLYEWAGGREVFRRLIEAFYDRVERDELISPLFPGGVSREHREIPARTPLSDAVSKELKRRGFSFVGSTICYAYLEAVGVVNDHLTCCFRYDEIARR